MKCDLLWQNQYVAAQKAENASLLQDERYGRALAATGRLKPRIGQVLIDGTPAGRVQMFEVRALGGLVHGITLDRGPAWFKGFGGAHHLKAFFEEWSRLYPRRFGRKRRILPEISDGAAARRMLESAGLERVGEGYQTFLLDLAQPLEALRARLEQKWRNVLNRAERKEDLVVEWDDEARQLPWFLKVYAQDKARKAYDGPASAFLSALALEMTGSGDMIIGRVMQDGMALSAVLIVRHGKSATYLAGWTGPAGREAGAHHLVLWHALGMLQNKGVTQFDLGGFNDESAKGIRDFKEGMGGQIHTLAGFYR